jgi:hypothetical protein
MEETMKKRVKRAYRRRSMTDSDLRRFAEVGAEQKLRELTTECTRILKEFPSLGRVVAEPVVVPRSRPAKAELPTPPSRRRRLTLAQRKAISQRVKAYWQNRRDEKRKSA